MASVATDHDAAVSDLGTMGTRPCASAPRGRPRQATTPHLGCIEAAGPWGYWRSGELTHQGQVGGGVAPARMPHTAGDRVNTDRRDAVQLARLRRSGDLTAGDVPALNTEGGLTVPESDVAFAHPT